MILGFKITEGEDAKARSLGPRRGVEEVPRILRLDIPMARRQDNKNEK